LTVEDTTAPVLDLADMVTLECSTYDAGTVFGGTITDACSAIDIQITDAPVSGGCVAPVGSYIRFYVVTDACGNSAEFMQILHLQDTTAPVVDLACPADITVEADAVCAVNLAPAATGQAAAVATDNCEVTPDLVVSYVDTAHPATSCNGTFLVERTWTAVATDHCNNTTTEVCTQVITVVVNDDQAPMFVEALPADATVECTSVPAADVLTATDNCDAGASVAFTEVRTDGACDQTYVLTRTWTAADCSGNATVHVQTLQVVDTQAPVFVGNLPADATVSCDAVPAAGTPLVMDACDGDFTLQFEETTVAGSCPENYTLVRTWTASDCAGNVSSYVQTLEVVDTTAPVIYDSEGVADGGIIGACCTDDWGTVEIPEPLFLAVGDNCSGTVTVDYSEVGSTYAPNAAGATFCGATTPTAMGTGTTTCDNYAPHSARLFNFAGDEFYVTESGTMTTLPDGTRNLNLVVASANNPDAGWTFNMNFGAGMDWAAWQAQPGNQSYKSDCGLGDHTQWMYHMTLNNSTATGWGDYDGSLLTLSHQPANGFYGFQIGAGANNKNDQFGFSGWFFYTGTFNGQAVTGFGDVFGDLDCCMPFTIDRTYVLTDCSGNTETFTYTVDVNGAICAPTFEGEDGNGPIIPIDDDANATLGGSEDEGKDDSKIKILGLNPNPVETTAILSYLVTEDSRVRIEVYDLNGVVVLTLFEGTVTGGLVNHVVVPVETLAGGMYQLQILSKKDLATQKLMVVD